MRRRDVLRLGVSSLAATATAGCLGGPPSSATVGMTTDFAFDPEAVTVAAGGTVTWTNGSGVGHTVTAYGDRIPDAGSYFASGGFDSERAARQQLAAGLVGPDGTYEHTFETVGTYEYVCLPHESSGMTGTVTVE